MKFEVRSLRSDLIVPFPIVPVKARILTLCVIFSMTSTTTWAQDAETAETAVRQVLSDQQAAWNEGDIEAFMDGYWRSDSLRFASGGEVQHGWQATLDRYHATYPDRGTMGQLLFTVYSVDVLSTDDAFVFGRYTLERKQDQPTGLFTLLFRRFEDGWKIVFDHTSVDTSGEATLPDTTWTISDEIQDVFDSTGVEGVFVLHEVGTREYWTNDRSRAETRFIPASTFKIFNALVALETGVIPDEDATFQWDGVERPVSQWNQNHDLASAIRVSAVWYFQELARRIGNERMQHWIDTVNYGNRDIGGDLDSFWLTGNIRISPIEQIHFLERLHANDLPFSQRSMDIVRRILILEETSERTLRGKTGWGDIDGKGVGWFVGYLERGDEVWIFANNITIVDDEDARHRVGIAKRLLPD